MTETQSDISLANSRESSIPCPLSPPYPEHPPPLPFLPHHFHKNRSGHSGACHRTISTPSLSQNRTELKIKKKDEHEPKFSWKYKVSQRQRGNKGKKEIKIVTHTHNTPNKEGKKGGSQGGSRIFRESEIPRRRSAPVSRLTRKQEPAPEDHPLQSTPHSPLPNLSTLINPFPRVR